MEQSENISLTFSDILIWTCVSQINQYSLQNIKGLSKTFLCVHDKTNMYLKQIVWYIHTNLKKVN